MNNSPALPAPRPGSPSPLRPMPYFFFARTNLLVNSNRPVDFWMDNPIQVDAARSDFDLHEVIRTETVSQVFRAVHRATQTPCDIKQCLAVWDIKREIGILRELGGLENTPRLVAVFQDPVVPFYYSLVVEPFDNMPIAERMQTLTGADVRFYMFQLLRALHHAHRRGIIHRNVRPENVLIDHGRRTVRLVDWAISEFYIPAHAYDVLPGDFNYKSPELLLGIPFIEYTVDMWAFGCVLAAMTYRNATYFNGFTAIDQLQRICMILGTAGLRDFIATYDLPKLPDSFPDYMPKTEWTDMVGPDNDHLMVEHLPDLLDRALEFDPYRRLTAQEAMDHPYFDAVRGPAQPIAWSLNDQ